MSFDKIHAARLTQLADRLDSDVPLGVGRFNFSRVYAPDLTAGGHQCGTMGCALGECAFMWPNVWKLTTPSGMLVTVNDPRDAHSTNQWAVQEWFGIKACEFRHLFFPGEQSPDECGGVELGATATRHEVAANIRAFLAVKGAQQEGAEA